MRATTLIAPGRNMVLPLLLEFIVKPRSRGKAGLRTNCAERRLIAYR
jgi:hypothetical protein